MNSNSFMSYPVYQRKKALRLSMALNCPAVSLNLSFTATEWPTNVLPILPCGKITHTDDSIMLGILSPDYLEFMFSETSTRPSTSLAEKLVLNPVQAVS